MEKVKNFINYLDRKSFILSGIISFFAIFLGIMGVIFGSLGVCLVCVIPFIAFILGIFGLTIGSLLDYNLYFIAAGILLLILSIYLYRRKSCNNKTCKIK